MYFDNTKKGQLKHLVADRETKSVEMTGRPQNVLHGSSIIGKNKSKQTNFDF